MSHCIVISNTHSWQEPITNGTCESNSAFLLQKAITIKFAFLIRDVGAYKMHLTQSIYTTLAVNFHVHLNTF